LKEFSTQENEQSAVSPLFHVEESALLTVADYFRDLSLNYHDYVTGFAPWPPRPEGLKVVLDTDYEETA
jgi:hypothetical protein